MAVRYTVHGDTAAEAAEALVELCELVGAAPTSRAFTAGGERWLARAVKVARVDEPEND